MAAAERNNPSVDCELLCDFPWLALDRRRLGHICDLGSNIRADVKFHDVLVLILECLRSDFVSAEAKKGGEFSMGTSARPGWKCASTVSSPTDRPPDLQADFILADQPGHVSDWGGEWLMENQCRCCGVPANDDANFAQVQHMVHHLDLAGVAWKVRANGSMWSSHLGRSHQSEADLVNQMVAQGRAISSTPIAACLWRLGRRRPPRGETLFSDEHRAGRMVDGMLRVLNAGEPFEGKLRPVVGELQVPPPRGTTWRPWAFRYAGMADETRVDTA